MNNKVQVNTNSEHRLIGLGNIKHPAIEYTYQVDESDLPEDIHEQLCDYLYFNQQFVKQAVKRSSSHQQYLKTTLHKVNMEILNYQIDIALPSSLSKFSSQLQSEEDYLQLLKERKALVKSLIENS